MALARLPGRHAAAVAGLLQRCAGSAAGGHLAAGHGASRQGAAHRDAASACRVAFGDRRPHPTAQRRAFSAPCRAALPSAAASDVCHGDQVSRLPLRGSRIWSVSGWGGHASGVPVGSPRRLAGRAAPGLRPRASAASPRCCSCLRMTPQQPQRPDNHGISSPSIRRLQQPAGCCDVHCPLLMGASKAPAPACRPRRVASRPRLCRLRQDVGSGRESIQASRPAADAQAPPQAGRIPPTSLSPHPFTAAGGVL